MLDRLSTLSEHGRTLRDITLVQYDLAKTNRQISSGKKAVAYDEMNGVVERVSAGNTKISRIDNYVQNNTTVKSNLQSMDKSIEQIQKALSEFSSNLTIRRSASTSEQMNFQGLAQNALDKVVGALNINVAGKYLFSGTKTDIKPVSDNPSLSEIGTPDSNYYNGNGERMVARISDEQSIEYGATADETGFQQAIAAILTAKDADTNNYEADFKKAIDLIAKAQTNLTGTRARVGTSMVNIETANTDHGAMKIYWNQAVAEDVDTDIAEASIKLAADQTVLQATYQMFALTSKLKLSEYLR